MTRSRPIAILVALLTAFALAAALLVAPSAGAQALPELTRIRAASHSGFDRVVFEFRNGLPDWIRVEPVEVLWADPVDLIVPIAGQARLRVRLSPVVGFDLPQGHAHPELQNVTETRRVSGPYEGEVGYGIGLRHAASFNVTTLGSPPRVVIDISHTALPTVDLRAGTMYGLDETGRLRWHRHTGVESGAYDWILPNFGNVVGEGFGAFARLLSGGGGVLYGVDNAGNLRWYRHTDPLGGAFAWTEAGFGNVVGTGWGSFLHIVPDGFGRIYTVDAEGTLRGHEHHGRNDGSFNWASPGGRMIGDGFNVCTALFSGGPGILYCVRDGGQLQWWRYRGDPQTTTGPSMWLGGNVVGSGWDAFAALWSGGNGVIYAVDGAGNLRWYRHLGSETGTYEWETTNFGNVIGSGWNAFDPILTGGRVTG